MRVRKRAELERENRRRVDSDYDETATDNVDAESEGRVKVFSVLVFRLHCLRFC